MVDNVEWINLYLKYNILEPLTKCHLEMLLEEDNNELILDKVLCKLNNEQKLELLKNCKLENYWLYMKNETKIINSFSKYGINIPLVFIHYPDLYERNITVTDKVNDILNEFRETYKDIDKFSLDTVVYEFKRKNKMIDYIYEYQQQQEIIKKLKKNK